jgi:general nucleoside transport system permease protein
MRFELREATSPLLLVMTPIAAIVLSLLLCAGFIAAAGAPVLGAYGHLAKGAFGSTFAITETLTRATPLILTGLSAAVAFRARLWNIGAEGQLYLGAIVTAALGAHVEGLPGWLADLVLILCGGLAGMFLLLGPTLLKLKLGVDEVVTTLLLNFMVLLLVSAETAPVISQVNVTGRPSRIDFRYQPPVKQHEAAALWNNLGVKT